MCNISEISFKCFLAFESVRGKVCLPAGTMNKGSLDSPGQRAIMECKALIGQIED